MCPHSPPILFIPCKTFLFTIIPPPTPVPIITPKTTGYFLPAPSTASERAKQLASFSKFISLSSRFSRSFFIGFPFNQIEFAFLTNEESTDIAPGIPIPTDSTNPNSFSNSTTRDLIPFNVP